MAESTSPQVEIIWSGKTYKYKLSMREIEELEDAFDKPIGEVDLNRSKATMYLIAFGARRSGDAVSLDELRDMDPDAFMSAIDFPDEPEPEVQDEDPTPAADVDSKGGSNGSGPKSSGKRSSKRAATSGS